MQYCFWRMESWVRGKCVVGSGSVWSLTQGWVPVCRQESGGPGVQLQAGGSPGDTAAQGRLGLMPEIADSLSPMLGAGPHAGCCAHSSELCVSIHGK